MNCAWQSFLNVVPIRFRCEVDRLGAGNLQELRLRIGQKPKLCTSESILQLNDVVTLQDLQYCVNASSQYSPWSASTIKEGYITISGGHRVGVCGKVAVSDGQVVSFQSITAVTIRVSRNLVGIAAGLEYLEGSLLILGSPGTGKTTLLRDLIRRKSACNKGSICVIDEREELFPVVNGEFSYDPGENTDVLSAYPKVCGVLCGLRNMGPRIICTDEITHPADCRALIEASWCGVELIATAHASDKLDYLSRPVYKPLVESGLFQTLVILRQDKTWYLERITI